MTKNLLIQTKHELRYMSKRKHVWSLNTFQQQCAYWEERSWSLSYDHFLWYSWMQQSRLAQMFSLNAHLRRSQSRAINDKLLCCWIIVGCCFQALDIRTMAHLSLGIAAENGITAVRRVTCSACDGPEKTLLAPSCGVRHPLSLCLFQQPAPVEGHSLKVQMSDFQMKVMQCSLPEGLWCMFEEHLQHFKDIQMLICKRNTQHLAWSLCCRLCSHSAKMEFLTGTTWHLSICQKRSPWGSWHMSPSCHKFQVPPNNF